MQYAGVAGIGSRMKIVLTGPLENLTVAIANLTEVDTSTLREEVVARPGRIEYTGLADAKFHSRT